MTPTLAPAHQRELVEASGITPDVIAERGYVTVWGAQDPTLLRAGFKEAQRRGMGWAAPLRSPLGGTETIYKPDTPRERDGKGIKYEYPQGHATILDAHPRTLPVLGDPAIPLWIVEGVKKGDCLVGRGLYSVNLCGVYNFRGRNSERGLTALPDWEAVALNGRDIYVCFDSDAASNPSVSKARDRLARFLGAKGSKVQIVNLPPGPGGAKQGVDDFLVAGGSVEALLSLAVPAEQAGPETPVLTRISEVEREEVSWRWPDWLALGKLHVVSGDPGEGKSWLTMALATPITLGRALPGDTGTHEPANVLLLNAEDGAADTIRPRLEDMGADLARVIQFSFVRDANGNERWINLANDLTHLENVLAVGRFQLVIIDPINAYLGTTDAHKDTAIRSVLGPLAALAERYRVAIVVLRHLTKGSRDKPLYRGLGGIGYTGAARIEWLVGRNPDDDAERVILQVKNNLAPLAQPLAFELTEGRFTWRGATAVTAEQLLTPQNREARDALAEAKSLLTEALKDGPQPSRAIEAEARAASISAMTLKRARWDLGVEARKVGFGKDGFWEWSLRGSSSENNVAPLGGSTPHTNGAAARVSDTENAKGFKTLGSNPEPLSSPLRGSGVQVKKLEPLSNAGEETTWLDPDPSFNATGRPVCAEHAAGDSAGGSSPQAAVVLTRAHELGWPRLRFSAVETIIGGEDAWRCFASCATPERLQLAWEAIDGAAF